MHSFRLYTDIGQSHRQTDVRTDGETDGRTDGIDKATSRSACIAC